MLPMSVGGGRNGNGDNDDERETFPSPAEIDRRANTIRMMILFVFLLVFIDISSVPTTQTQKAADGTTSYSLSLQILALMTALTILPSLVLGMTSFTRIIIVLSLLRQAMGTQQTPPNQVLIAIALFLTFFIMSPTLTAVYEKAGDPYLNGQIGAEAALDTATIELKEFMVKNTRKNDLNMFMDLGDNDAVETPADVPLSSLLPAFMFYVQIATSIAEHI